MKKKKMERRNRKFQERKQARKKEEKWMNKEKND